MNTSTNTSSTTPSIYDISVTILNAQFVSNICLSVVSIIAVIISVLQIATTVLWKPLRKIDQSLIFALAVIDCLKSADFGTLATWRIYALTTGGNDVENQLMCMVRLTLPVFPYYTMYFLIIMLSLDRLTGLALPIWYKNREAKFRVAQIISSCLLGCSIGATMFVGVSADKLVPVCAFGSSPTESFLYYDKYFENFIVCFTLGINAISCAILFHKWRKARRTVQTLTMLRKNVQLGALKTLTAVVLVYLSSSAASSVFLMILNSAGFGDETRMSYAPLTGLFELFRGVLDFPMYVLLVSEYRNGFREIVMKRMRCCLAGSGQNNLHLVSGSSMHHQTGGAVGRRMTKVDAM